MSLQLDKSYLKEVERGISPPMGVAITIPVRGAKNATIYVCSSAFRPSDIKELREVAQRLTLSLEEESQ